MTRMQMSTTNRSLAWKNRVVSAADAIQLIREGGRLRVEDAPGVKLKFVDQVEHRTFSGTLAARHSQPVLYVTERCVFELRADGRP